MQPAAGSPGGARSAGNRRRARMRPGCSAASIVALATPDMIETAPARPAAAITTRRGLRSHGGMSGRPHARPDRVPWSEAETSGAPSVRVGTAGGSAPGPAAMPIHPLRLPAGYCGSAAQYVRACRTNARRAEAFRAETFGAEAVRAHARRGLGRRRGSRHRGNCRGQHLGRNAWHRRPELGRNVRARLGWSPNQFSGAVSGGPGSPLSRAGLGGMATVLKRHADAAYGARASRRPLPRVRGG